MWFGRYNNNFRKQKNKENAELKSTLVYRIQIVHFAFHTLRHAGPIFLGIRFRGLDMAILLIVVVWAMINCHIWYLLMAKSVRVSLSSISLNIVVILLIYCGYNQSQNLLFHLSKKME